MSARPATSEDRFRAAMVTAGHIAPKVVPAGAVVPLRKGDVHLGDLADGARLGANLKKLIEGRLLIHAASGAGKSWTIRRLMEQTAGLVQQIVIDPEGEFRSLADEYEMLVIDATRLNTSTIAEAARRVREHQISVLVDLSELDREEQMKMFAAFITPLVEAPKAHWHPCMVAVDEAQIFAPFGGQASEATSVRRMAIAALVDLMSRGRKRGLCGILATLRLARLAKSVTSDIHNFLIGITTLDLDIRRSAATVGWDASRGFKTLPGLTPGEFVAVGPAFSQAAQIAKIGPVITTHSGASPDLKRLEIVELQAAADLLDLEGLAQAAAADTAIVYERGFLPGLKAVRRFIKDPAFPLTGPIWRELKVLAPDGAAISALPPHLNAPASEVAGALALLDRFGVLEFSGEGENRAVRLSEAGQA